MTAQIIPLTTLPHPWGTAGREFFFVEFQAGETLGAYVQRHGIALPRFDFNVWHNGRLVPDALWMRLIPRAGDQIIIRAKQPEGGGGGGKVIRAVALIALTVATYGVGSWGGIAAMAGSYSGVVGAAMMIGGSLVITPLFPEIK